MLSEELCRRVLAAAASTGADYAELYAENTVDHAIRMIDSKEDSVRDSVISGVGIRVCKELRSMYATTVDISESGLLRSASMAGKETTGNAAKSGYDKPLMISPFTMYLAPGQYTPEQLLDKAGKGEYICTLSGLHAGTNPVTGDFSLQSEGYLIKNGKKTTHVSAFTVAGNFYQMLKDITAVGKDLTLPSPTDMNTYGSPTVLVENLSVAGK